MTVADEAALTRSIRRGALWSVLNTVLTRAAGLATGIVLARLLAPDDFGAYAVALVVLNVVMSMNELGISLAVIRWEGDPGEIAPTVASLTIASSVTLYAACFSLAPAFSAWMGSASAADLIRVLCLCIVIDAITAVPAGVMTRLFMQKARAIIDLSGVVLSTVVTIGLALAGAGAWSLVVGFVGSSVLVGVGCLVASPWRFRLGFRRSLVRPLLAFGLPLALSSLLMILLVNVDYLVVGNRLGETQLGFYLIAFNLSSWPVQIISVTLRRLSLAGFSRVLEGGRSATEVFPQTLRLVLDLFVPVALPLVLLATPLITVVYGPKWAPAAAVLPWLAVLGLGRILAELTYDFLISTDHNRFTVVLHLVWLVALVPALWVGATGGGIVGVGIAHAAVVFGCVLPLVAWAAIKADVAVRALLVAVAGPAGKAVLVAAVVAPVWWLVEQPWLVLVLGLVIIGGLSLLLNRPVIRMALHELRDRP